MMAIVDLGYDGERQEGSGNRSHRSYPLNRSPLIPQP